MIKQKLLLSLIFGALIFTAPGVLAQCATNTVSPHSEIVYDGAAKFSDRGFVSDGTIIIDAHDLQRKRCNKERWQLMPLDGINVTPLDPWAERQADDYRLPRGAREALMGVGQIRCSQGTGSGFLLDLNELGASRDRDYDIVVTSCHVVTSGNCRYFPRISWREQDPQTAINSGNYNDIYGNGLPLSKSISELICDGSKQYNLNKKFARNDWVFAKIDQHISNLPDRDRMKFTNYNHNIMKSVSKREDLFVIGAPSKRVLYNNRPYAIYDMVYSTGCGADVKSNNVIHTCISFPGMSGGPTGYFDRQGYFNVVGVNSWASELVKDLSRKKAEQIQRGAATAFDTDIRNRLARFIDELETNSQFDR